MPIPANYDLIGTQMPWWLVISCRNRWYLKNFVECGAGYGHTSAIACDHFEKVWAVELDQNVFNHQVPELKRAKNATRLQGSTLEYLPAVIQEAQGPACWYIDSHYVAMGPKLAAECPILGEIAILKTRPRIADDVLIIDNFGMFERPPQAPHNPREWPHCDDIFCELKSLSLCVRFHADIIIATPTPLSERV